MRKDKRKQHRCLGMLHMMMRQARAVGGEALGPVMRNAARDDVARDDAAGMNCNSIIIINY